MSSGERGFTLIELLIVVAIIGIIAAIAIPSLIRARVAANESATVGDIRTVISAEAAYQSANLGYFEGNISCMATNNGCILPPNATAPTFLDSQIASLNPKSGYFRTFVQGPAAPVIEPAMSPSSAVTYVYEATPLAAGQSGVRGFGGDSSGIICFSTDATPPTVVAGRLDTSAANCTTLK